MLMVLSMMMQHGRSFEDRPFNGMNFELEDCIRCSDRFVILNHSAFRGTTRCRMESRSRLRVGQDRDGGTDN